MHCQWVLIYDKHLKRLICLVFRLLENETTEMFNMGERSKSKCKFSGMKVCEADKEREYVKKAIIENEVLASV